MARRQNVNTPTRYMERILYVKNYTKKVLRVQLRCSVYKVTTNIKKVFKKNEKGNNIFVALYISADGFSVLRGLG